MAGYQSFIDESKFKLPDMGDYYDEDLVKEFLSNVSESEAVKDITDAAYYTEEPFSTELGYHDDYNVFVLSANPVIKKYDKNGNTDGELNELLNNIDGDTVIFDLSSTNDGGNPFVINDVEYKGFKDYCFAKADKNNFLQNIFKIRTVGINAPEVPHYKYVSITRDDYNKSVHELTIDEIKKKKNIKYEINKDRRNGTKYKFLDIKGTLYEIIRDPDLTVDSVSSAHHSESVWDNSIEKKQLDDIATQAGIKTMSVMILQKDEQVPNDIDGGRNYGLYAKELLLDLLNEAQDIRIIVDAKQVVKPGATGIYQILQYGLGDDYGIRDIIFSYYQTLFGSHIQKYGAFTTFGQDAYKRFLGAIYVKKKVDNTSVWINVSKYILSMCNKEKKHIALMFGNSPNQISNYNNVSEAFKLWTYDSSKSTYADAFMSISNSDLDDRRSIQKEITGLDFSVYRDYTVMIGDCLFMVPPTSIRLINQIESERVALLRSKGTATKTNPTVNRIVEMTLYFNNDSGINGIPINRKLPSQNGSSDYETYYMNGLRSLIAMFKYTPFLPIENEYINDTLNIEAVSLVNLQIQSMPMYPKCMVATLTLQEFNYRIYMNELPLPNPEKGEDYDTNMFAKTINYEVMRYYYQKAIRNGEALKDLKPDDQQYIESTMGSKTNLIPMTFQDQNIEFYILDSGWCDKVLAVQKMADNRSLSHTQIINEDVEIWAQNVGTSLGSIIKEIESKNYSEMKWDAKNDNGVSERLTAQYANELSELFILSGKCPNLLSIGYTEIKITGTNKGVMSYRFNFALDNLTSAELENLMMAVSEELDDIDVAKRFTNGSIFFSFELSDGKMTLLRDIDWNIAYFFAYRSGALVKQDSTGISDNWSNFSASANANYFASMKDGIIDIETMYSAKFQQYPFEDIVAQNFSISMGNTFTQTSLKSQEGYAPQYCGGQDTIVEFMFYTKDKEAVKTLNAMQSIAANDLIKYRRIIPCWPIRISSEMTRLCGINEVAIESIDISTVPNQPGLYAVQVRAMSVDRTMRNREALQRLDQINNAGAINASGIKNYIKKTYFELNNTLAKAEVYPDLELPTIEELEKCGFKYIRYMNSKNKRTYPDPDFYFVYGYVYSAQMLRKTIIDYFKTNGASDSSSAIAGIATTFMDTADAQEVNVQYTSEDDNVLGFNFLYPEKYDKWNKSIQEITQAIADAKKSGDDSEVATLTNIYNDYEQCQTLENQIITSYPAVWNICNDIKCTFASDANNTDEMEAFSTAMSLMKEELVSVIDECLTKPISISSKYNVEVDTTDNNAFIDQLYKKIDQYASNKYGNTYDVWNKLINMISAGNKDGINGASISKIKKTLKGMLKSAAMAMSANQEFDSGVNKSNYNPIAIFNLGVEDTTTKSMDKGNASFKGNVYYNCRAIDSNTSEWHYVYDIDEACKTGVTFGPYQIQRYSSDFLSNIYKEHGSKFTKREFLDPYYNNVLNKELSETELNEYISKNLTCPAYMVESFMRNTLVWMRHLIMEDVIVNYYDVLRDDMSKIFSYMSERSAQYDKSQWDVMVGEDGVTYYANKKTGEVIAKGDYEAESDIINSTLTEYASSMKNVVNKYETQIVAGKVFTAILASIMQGEGKIFENIMNRKIETLETLTSDCQKSLVVSEATDNGIRVFRKFIRGLSKWDILDESELGSGISTVFEDAIASRNQSVWLQANKNPELWMLHSFHDMVVNSKRGRMARAFPTYYMLLIDEGREIGYWKLHDNFYNTSSISEIEVIKSRKMPADTARIVMTNVYQSFTTDDTDYRTNYYHTAKDVFTSIFSPRLYFNEEEQTRTEAMEMNTIKLQPGARVHLRMGYSSDASELPTVFNGVVAEVNAGEIIELIAQGDGHEISNPGVFSGIKAVDAAELQNEGDFFSWFENFFEDGATPKELIKNIFTTKSGFVGKFVNQVTNGRFFNDNMFGMTHFGEIDYKHIHKDGEVMQNIYEGEGGMPWQSGSSNGTTAQYYSEVAPEFTIELKDKSIWDVLNICASASCEFTTGVIPFGVRSSVFHGRPHYYCAYDYDVNDNGEIVELRKPFQQYHIIDSYSDIIYNNISSNGKDIRTVAVPIYKGAPKGGIDTIEKRLDPLYIDWDIYPEYQKTMLVDTQMTYKANKAGFLFVNYYKDKWSNEGGAKIAWRMGAKALKDSVKDMYTGEVTIIGDTAIKPLDKIYLYDIYEDMNGLCEVEAVVHRMSTDTGFTTSIYPDCISTVDSRYETLSRMWTNQIATQVIVAKGLCWSSSALFGTSKSFLSVMAKATAGTALKATSYLNKASKLLGFKEIADVDKAANWTAKLLSAGGASGATSAALAVGVATQVVEAAIMYVLVKNAYTWVESTMASFNVLTIFPLNKNGLAYVAGINGHKGLVVGSTTWNSEGPIDIFIDWAFKDHGWFHNTFVKGVLFSDNMKAIAETYKKDKKLGSEGNSTEYSIQNLLEIISESQTSSFSAYKAMVFADRVWDLSSEKASSTFYRSSVLNVIDNVVETELIPLTKENPTLKKYYDNNFFRPFSYDVGSTEGEVYTLDTSSCGEVVFCSRYENDKTVEDIPFLRPDAYQILRKIIDDLYEKETNTLYGNDKLGVVYLSSATKVGSSQWNSTGYFFKIQYDNVTLLESVIRNIQDEFKELYSNNDTDAPFGLIEYKKATDNPNSIIVAIAPRAVKGFAISTY